MTGLDRGLIQDVLLTICALAMGFYYGSLYVARRAFVAMHQRRNMLLQSGTQDWVSQAQMANKIALAVFTLSLVAVVAIEYYEVKYAG